MPSTRRNDASPLGQNARAAGVRQHCRVRAGGSSIGMSAMGHLIDPPGAADFGGPAYASGPNPSSASARPRVNISTVDVNWASVHAPTSYRAIDLRNCWVGT